MSVLAYRIFQTRIEPTVHALTDTHVRVNDLRPALKQSIILDERCNCGSVGLNCSRGHQVRLLEWIDERKAVNVFAVLRGTALLPEVITPSLDAWLAQ